MMIPVMTWRNTLPRRLRVSNKYMRYLGVFMLTPANELAIITVSSWSDKPKVSTERCFWPFCILIYCERCRLC